MPPPPPSTSASPYNYNSYSIASMPKFQLSFDWEEMLTTTIFRLPVKSKFLSLLPGEESLTMTPMPIGVLTKQTQRFLWRNPRIFLIHPLFQTPFPLCFLADFPLTSLDILLTWGFILSLLLEDLLSCTCVSTAHFSKPEVSPGPPGLSSSQSP